MTDNEKEKSFIGLDINYEGVLDVYFDVEQNRIGAFCKKCNTGFRTAIIEKDKSAAISSNKKCDDEAKQKEESDDEAVKIYDLLATKLAALAAAYEGLRHSIKKNEKSENNV